MAIPETQLETWSHQGAVQTSKDTYATIKRALEGKTAHYSNRTTNVFLQGSYGNDTNIYTESDVDVVISCSDVFYYDIKQLPADQQTAFRSNNSDSTYAYNDFKNAVKDALVQAFGNSVQVGTKAFKIAPNGSRRSADVVPAFEHHRYQKYISSVPPTFYEGISFFTKDNNRIDNFPKLHSVNLTTKHQATTNRFKPTIRMFKNIRSAMVELEMIDNSDAPSYFIEGLLYNAPNELFENGKSTTVFNILKWLHDTTDKSNFVCANERYYLFCDGDPVCVAKS